MPNYLVGFFRVPNVEGIITVETLLSGNAKRDYAALQAELKKKYPKLAPGDAIRTGSTIETREETAPYINPYPGMTLRQMFVDVPTADGSGAESFREIGTVFFDGASHDITLRYLQDKGTVGITLTDRMSRNATRFSNQLNAGIPIEQLPQLIAEVLGDCKELKLRMMKHPTLPVAGALPKRAPVDLAKKLEHSFMPPEKLPAPKTSPPAPVAPTTSAK